MIFISLRLQGYPPTTLSISSAYVGVDRYIHLRSSSQDRGQLPDGGGVNLGKNGKTFRGFHPIRFGVNVWQKFHHLQSSTNWTSNGATYKQHLNLKTHPIFSHLPMVNQRESLLHKKQKKKNSCEMRRSVWPHKKWLSKTCSTEWTYIQVLVKRSWWT